MSRKKTQSTGERQDSQAGPVEKVAVRAPATEDLWGNLIYFAIVTSAICFVLVNNSASALLTSTGVGVLAVLLFLDMFAMIPLGRLLFGVLAAGGNERERKG